MKQEDSHTSQARGAHCDPESGVKCPLLEKYGPMPSDEFQAHVIDALARIETKIEVIPSLDDRVDRLESWRDRIIGGGLLLGTLSGIAEYLFHRKG